MHKYLVMAAASLALAGCATADTSAEADLRRTAESFAAAFEAQDWAKTTDYMSPTCTAAEKAGAVKTATEAQATLAGSKIKVVAVKIGAQGDGSVTSLYTGPAYGPAGFSSVNTWEKYGDAWYLNASANGCKG